MIELYEVDDGVIGGVPLEPDELGAASACLPGWMGRSQPATGGGLRLVPPGIAEIKRTYVHPRFHGQGVARALLGTLENEAVCMGATVARLDTGPKQPIAVQRSGYREIDNRNQSRVAAFWGEKSLT